MTIIFTSQTSFLVVIKVVEDARNTVEFWFCRNCTSFERYFVASSLKLKQTFYAYYAGARCLLESIHHKNLILGSHTAFRTPLVYFCYISLFDNGIEQPVNALLFAVCPNTFTAYPKARTCSFIVSLIAEQTGFGIT